MVSDNSETESPNLKWKKNVCKQDSWYSFTHSCITCFPGNKPNNLHYCDDFFSINRNICIFLFRLSVIPETTWCPRWAFIETMDFLTLSQFETKNKHLTLAQPLVWEIFRINWGSLWVPLINRLWFYCVMLLSHRAVQAAHISGWM